MTDCNREPLPGAHAPVLDAALLARIHELNLDYVELLIADYVASGRSAYFLPLPASVLESLMCLSREQRRRLASTSYTLYCVSFDGIAFWRASNEALQSKRVASRDDANGDQSHGAFCEIALFLAWHISVSNAVAARVLYAMSDAMIARLAEVPLWSLRRIAVDCAGLLMPRWPANPCFWPDLVRFAAANDARRLNAAQLLGNQLISLELDRTHRVERRSHRTPARVNLPSASVNKRRTDPV